MSWIKATGFSADDCAFEFYWQGISVFVLVDHQLKDPTIVCVCVCVWVYVCRAYGFRGQAWGADCRCNQSQRFDFRVYGYGFQVRRSG